MFGRRAISMSTPSKTSSIGINTNQVTCHRSWSAHAMPLAMRIGPATIEFFEDETVTLHRFSNGLETGVPVGNLCLARSPLRDVRATGDKHEHPEQNKQHRH